MKKIFSLVLLFLVSYESSALSNQSAINQYLKNKKLDKLEGIWYSPPDNLGNDANIIIYKYGNNYNALSLSGSKTNTMRSNRFQT
jgi:hypothetical protein